LLRSTLPFWQHCWEVLSFLSVFVNCALLLQPRSAVTTEGLAGTLVTPPQLYGKDRYCYCWVSLCFHLF
jgi:hypothetical protein